MAGQPAMPATGPGGEPGPAATRPPCWASPLLLVPAVLVRQRRRRVPRGARGTDSAGCSLRSTAVGRADAGRQLRLRRRVGPRARPPSGLAGAAARVGDRPLDLVHRVGRALLPRPRPQTAVDPGGLEGGRGAVVGVAAGPRLRPRRPPLRRPAHPPGAGYLAQPGPRAAGPRPDDARRVGGPDDPGGRGPGAGGGGAGRRRARRVRRDRHRGQHRGGAARGGGLPRRAAGARRYPAPGPRQARGPGARDRGRRVLRRVRRRPVRRSLHARVPGEPAGIPLAAGRSEAGAAQREGRPGIR